METGRSMVELAEWSSFNGVSVNDEAEFIAQLFPNSSLTNELDSSSNIQALSSSTCWTSNDISINIAGYYDETNTSFYSSDHNTNTSSFYSNFSQGSCNSYDNTNLYLRDDNSQFLEPNTGSLPFAFVMNGANSTYSEAPDINIQLKRDSEMSETELPAAEEKISSDISENTRKRYRVSDNKGKRMARPKKNQKNGEEEDQALNRQNSSSCSSQDDCNGSLEQIQINGKTRANRGSATDPQSIYARKRRERINERLRILQNLVPNGTKVDISTMLEEAVRYVKFLQLQIKLLSSDEMWMYAPLAYNGMDIGLDTLNIMLNKTKST